MNASNHNPVVSLSSTIGADGFVAFMTVGESGGEGIVENPYFNVKANRDECYKDYLVGKIAY